MRICAKIYEVNIMTRKILSVVICIAMLLSCLSVMSYAVDIVIDVSDLFNESDTTDQDTGKDDGKNEDTGDNKNDSSSNNKGNTGVGTTKPTDKTENTTTEPKDKTEETAVDPAWENNPFNDVKATDWYYSEVKYAVQNELFNGVSDDTFAPNSPLTRAMLVTILYRAEGEPEASASSEFSDIKASDWFGKAVIWASENGVVNGYDDGTFKPNANITREQIATIIYNFANYKKCDTSAAATTNIVNQYTDSMTVSAYAIKGFRYVVGEGIMNGKTENTLNPKDNATRAEAATILRRFLESK